MRSMSSMSVSFFEFHFLGSVDVGKFLWSQNRLNHPDHQPGQLSVTSRNVWDVFFLFSGCWWNAVCAREITEKLKAQRSVPSIP
jgi:hypothetical protein